MPKTALPSKRECLDGKLRNDDIGLRPPGGCNRDPCTARLNLRRHNLYCVSGCGTLRQSAVRQEEDFDILHVQYCRVVGT